MLMASHAMRSRDGKLHAMSKRPATYADLEALPPNQVGEILEGVLYGFPRPATPPRQGLEQLGAELDGPFDRGRSGPGGWLILDEPELHLREDVLVPYLAAWRRERMPEMPAAAFISIAPDWVCEVLSPSTAGIDRTEKLPIYARERSSTPRTPRTGASRRGAAMPRFVRSRSIPQCGLADAALSDELRSLPADAGLMVGRHAARCERVVVNGDLVDIADERLVVACAVCANRKRKVCLARDGETRRDGRSERSVLVDAHHDSVVRADEMNIVAQGHGRSSAPVVLGRRFTDQLGNGRVRPKEEQVAVVLCVVTRYRED